MKKHFCCYCLQNFSTEEILTSHINDCFKINGKQAIHMPKEGEYFKFKNGKRKINSPFMIYADFESILVPESNEKQNTDGSYTNRYQKHVAWGYGCKLVSDDDKSSKSFKSYLREDTVHNFIDNMIRENNYCTD